MLKYHGDFLSILNVVAGPVSTNSLIQTPLPVVPAAGYEISLKPVQQGTNNIPNVLMLFFGAMEWSSLREYLVTGNPQHWEGGRVIFLPLLCILHEMNL